MSDTMIAENNAVVATEETEETQGQPMPEQAVLSETQEQALAELGEASSVMQTVEPEVTPYSDDELAELKAQSEDEENLDPEVFTTDRMNDVRSGKLTEDQFTELMGMSYTDCLAELGETQEESSPGMGHNNPPPDEPVLPAPTALAVSLTEELKAFHPTVENAAEAETQLKEALNATVEHIGTGETSLASKGAIAISNYVAFNAGLRTDGNKLIAINADLYKNILEKVSTYVDPDDAKDPTFRATVGQMIQRAILIMEGTLAIGFFVLPGDRKRPRGADAAVLEYPNDIPEGCHIKRSTVIREGVLRPTIPNRHPTTKELLGELDNSNAQEWRLATNLVVESLYNALLDRDGKLQYDPITGTLNGFKRGQIVRQEIAAAEAAEAAKKAGAGKDEPAKRQTRGTQAEGNNLEQQNANLQQQLAQANADASAAVKANKGDIVSGLNALGALIRDTNQPLPQEARVVFWKDANAMFARRLLGPNVKPSKDELRELTKLLMNLDNHLKWDDNKAAWLYSNVDGSIVTTFEADETDKAA